MLRDLLRAEFWQAQLATPSAELLVKVTLLLLAAIVISVALRGAAAGVRHLLWATTIAALLVMPALSAVSPVKMQVLPSSLAAARGEALAGNTDIQSLNHRERGVHEAFPRGGEELGMAARVSGKGAPRTSDQGDVAGTAAIETTGDRSLLSAPSLAVLLVMAWGIVALGLVGRLFVGWLLVRRIARSGDELTTADWTTPLWEAADRLDLPDVPRLIRSDRVAMPFACGVRRPIIVLPPESEAWTGERRRAVLFHELAHVRRKDLLAHTLGRIACALYWPHPLVWSAARRLRAESERACDDLVLSTGTRASEYADHLLQIVTASRHSRAPAVALPMAQRREFEGRMLAILDPRERRRLPRVQAATVSVGVLMLAVLLAASAPTQRTSPDDESMLAASGTGDTVEWFDASEVKADGDEVSATSEKLKDHALSGRARYADEEADAEAEIAAQAEAAAEASATALATGRMGEGIAELATGVAQVTTDITMGVLRQIGIPVPAGEAAGQVRDSAQNARETALLVSVLASNRDATVRRTAAWGLYRRSGSDAADALRSALLNDPSDEVRETAAWALGHRRDARHGEALATAAARDRSSDVRATSAWSLGNLRARQHADALVPALSDERSETRMTAAWAMGQMRPQTAPAQLIALLDDPRAEVAEAAAWALSEIRDPVATPALLRALDASPRKGVREAIVRALVLTASRDAGVLEQLANSQHPDVQERAIRAMVSRGESWPWPWPWPRPRPMP